MGKWLAGLLTTALLAGAIAGGAASHDSPHAQALFHQDSRSWRWPRVRREHLLIEPACAVCGKLDDVEVHHCISFSRRPDLELVDGNLITLCRNHHFLFGHLLRWSSENPDVRIDATVWRDKIKARPE